MYLDYHIIQKAYPNPFYLTRVGKMLAVADYYRAVVLLLLAGTTAGRFFISYKIISFLKLQINTTRNNRSKIHDD